MNGMLFPPCLFSEKSWGNLQYEKHKVGERNEKHFENGKRIGPGTQSDKVTITEK